MTAAKKKRLEKKFEQAIQDKTTLNHSDPNIKHLVAELVEIFEKELK